MIRNYLKTAIRAFWKERTYSLINVLGLATGMVATLFIALFIAEEWSFDRFHAKGDRLYRLVERFRNGDEYTTTALTPYKAGPLLEAVSPAIEAVTRLDNTIDRAVFRSDDRRFEETTLTFVDSNFFQTFSFSLLMGDAGEVLRGPGKVVISEEKARHYFGDENPVGQSLQMIAGFGEQQVDLTVSGVLAPMPANSHFHYDFLISMPTGEALTPGKIDSWGWTSVYTYLRLAEGRTIEEVEAAIPAALDRHAPDWFPQWATFTTQPMLDIHLHSSLKDEIEANSDIRYVYIFSAIGLLILLIACINYVNLATARAARRAREVGLRKVVGARRRQLVGQFLTESFGVVLLAAVIALILVDWMLPLFNRLAGSDIEFAFFQDPLLVAGGVAVLAALGLLAGLYPALVLSGFQPVAVLKGRVAPTGSRTLALRRGLVVFQFTVSIALIVGVLVIHQQWQYLRDRNLGIDTEQTILLPINTKTMVENYRVFKEEALRHPGVRSMTAASKDPLDVFSNYSSFSVNGQETEITLPIVAVERDFFATYQAEMITGLPLDAMPADSTNAVVLNESAVALLGVEDPIGLQLRFGDDPPRRVVGVVEDFHFESLYSRIRPMCFLPTRDFLNSITVTIGPEDIDATLGHLESTWRRLGLEEAFRFRFLNDAIDQQYRAEANFLTVFLVFAAIAILIACLGIFGLSAYSVVVRRKEIGVRKVLGATSGQIALLMSRSFLWQVSIAFLVAVPVAWYVMHRWLEQFAYRVGIHPLVFIIAGLAALAIAWLAVSYNALRAAGVDPVKSLKYE